VYIAPRSSKLDDLLPKFRWVGRAFSGHGWTFVSQAEGIYGTGRASDLGYRGTLVTDNGTELTSLAMLARACDQKVRLCYIQPGKPTQNAPVESFNGKFRDECLNENTFDSLSGAREEIERWRIDYNATRPHRTLGQQTPDGLARSLTQPTALARNSGVPVRLTNQRQ